MTITPLSNVRTMLVHTALLADGAHVGTDGLLYVQGGGWQYHSVSQFPAQIAGVVAMLIEFADEEFGRAHRLDLTVVNDAGQPVGWSTTVSLLPHRRLFPLALPFVFVVAERTSAFHVELADANGVLARIDCDLQESS